MRPERLFKGRNGTGRASITALKTQIQGPAELNLLRAKNGLDIGGHFNRSQFLVHPEGRSIRHRAASHSEPGFRASQAPPSRTYGGTYVMPARPPRFLREACS